MVYSRVHLTAYIFGVSSHSLLTSQHDVRDTRFRLDICCKWQALYSKHLLQLALCDEDFALCKSFSYLFLYKMDQHNK